MAVYTFADQTHRWDSAWPMTYTGGPWKGLLHTTEGLTLPTYRDDLGRAGAKAPHFTLTPFAWAKDTHYHQHFDTARPSRALRNESGGVQTNTDQVIQIELVGTCDPSKRLTWTLGTRTYRAGVDYIYWPDAPQWALDEVARLMRWIEAAHGIPRASTSRPWLPYPRSYGASPARMTRPEWDNFAGWCGHQHAPENTHGDPGDIDITYLLSEEDDMTPDESAMLRGIFNTLMTGRPDKGLGSPEWPHPFTIAAATLVAAQTGARGVDAAAIAAAIPAELAREVADELAKRLSG